MFLFFLEFLWIGFCGLSEIFFYRWERRTLPRNLPGWRLQPFATKHESSGIISPRMVEQEKWDTNIQEPVVWYVSTVPSKKHLIFFTDLHNPLETLATRVWGAHPQHPACDLENVTSEDLNKLAMSQHRDPGKTKPNTLCDLSTWSISFYPGHPRASS